MAERKADAVGGLEAALHQPGPIPLAAELAVAPGEMMALVGPSGSGKTTILRAIAGLYRPRAGRVRVDGTLWLDDRQGVDVPSHRRAVGLVFQSYALFPHMTALANVALAVRDRSAGPREAAARRWLERVNLKGLEERRPAALSGGQQQRVAMARALARDPAVLLLDEPFSAVDLVTRRRLHRELAELRSSLAMPVVLVTHDLEEAMILADRMTVLHHGRTLQTAPPAELMARPATPLVARLVDHRNIFEGEVMGHEPGAGRTWLLWRGRRLEARLQTGFAPGSRVSWLIPPASVLLHRRDRPSRGERENPVEATVVSATPLGEQTHVTARMAADADRLAFSLSTHAARRNRIAAGAAIRVSLLADAIHLMPVEQPAAHLMPVEPAGHLMPAEPAVPLTSAEAAAGQGSGREIDGRD